MSAARFGLQVQDRWADPEGRLQRAPVPLTLEEAFDAARVAGFSAAMIVPESCFPLFGKRGPVRLQTICTVVFADAEAPVEDTARPALPTLPEAAS